MTEIKFKSDIDVELVDKMGGDRAIADAAWVSTGAKDKTDADVAGLISYLMKHRHGTPFEHSAMTLLVRAPLFVWREWHRHRIGFSYNEESARYKVLEPLFYIPSRERPMFKVDGWKPGRPKFTAITTVPEDAAYERLCMNLSSSYFSAYKSYRDNLSMGFDPGLARDCLPVGIYSSCFVTCNPRSMMAFLSLRTHEEAAKFVSYPLHEIELAARACEKIFKENWPVTHSAWDANGRVGP